MLDKTGTITEGKPQVTDIVVITPPDKGGWGVISESSETPLSSGHLPLSGEQEFVLAIAAALEQKSEHPLAEAIVQKANESGAPILETANFQAVPGRGVRAVINGTEYLLGTRLFLEENDIPLSAKIEDQIKVLEAEGKTVMLLADSIKLVAFIAVADTIKPTSSEAIARMQKLGIMVYMVTGDNARTARAIAAKVGIENVLSEVLPENKALEIKKLQQS